MADKLAVDLKGRIKLEDAGFDWKILGPDVQEVFYLAIRCHKNAACVIIELKIIILEDRMKNNYNAFFSCPVGGLCSVGLRSGCLCVHWSKVLGTINSLHARG